MKRGKHFLTRGVNRYEFLPEGANVYIALFRAGVCREAWTRPLAEARRLWVKLVKAGWEVF